MNLFLLLSFGLCFSACLIIYLNPKFVFPNSTYIYTRNEKIPITRGSSYFVFLFFFGSFFLVLSSFQYINTAEYARFPIGSGWSNDMSRYWFGFQDAGEYSLKKFMFSQGQEPIYLLLIFVANKITAHFSYILVFAYAFILISVLKFLKDFVKFDSFFTIIVFFSLFYTFILTSYCLFRMGLAVAVSLYTFRYIKLQKWKLAFVTAFIACGFHFSAAILFSIIVAYRIYNKKISFNFFMLIFSFVFLFGIIFAKIIPSILKIFSSRYMSYKAEGIAFNTYMTNFIFLILILYKRKIFFQDNIDDVCFITLLSSFFILDLQLVLGIFYRMIFFTYPCLVYIVSKLFKIYKVKKNEMLIPLCVRSFLIFYVFFFLYKFCTTSWFSYGLNNYELFYFY